MIADGIVVIRLLAAMLMGGMVGWERERKGHRAAGFRTHMLVSVGSCLIMLTGIHLFEIYRGIAPIDPGRMAAQVVSGIGFLGAGTILRVRDSVRGLTTAASLWAVAGIGLAIVTGFYIGAGTTTVIVLVVLFFLSRVEGRLGISKRSGTQKEA